MTDNKKDQKDIKKRDDDQTKAAETLFKMTNIKVKRL